MGRVSAATAATIAITAVLGVTSAASASKPLGGNLNGQFSWTADFAFADAFVTAGEPKRLNADGSINLGSPAPLDSSANPRTDFGVYVQEVAPEPGTYVVTGVTARRPEVRLSNTPGISGPVTWNPTTKTFRVSLEVADQGKPATDGRLIITFRATGGGVKNVHVIRPGNDAAHPAVWSNHYLAFLRAHSPTVLRAMDLVQTNNSAISAWSDRTLPGRWGRSTKSGTMTMDGGWTMPVTTERGMAWESVIDLCNAVQSDCWINVPLLASDDYVRKLAALAKARLRPSLNLWVEYSNEVWNDGFTQTQMNRHLAAGDVAAGRRRLNYDRTTDPVSRGDRRVASRLVEIGRIFRSAFVHQTARVKPVLAYQYANPDRTRNQLEYIDAVYGRPSGVISAIACAPYVNLGFHPDWSSKDVPGLSASDILGLLGADIATFESSAFMPDWKAMADRYGVALAGYEGGPDTFGENNIEAKTSATLSAGMRGLTSRYLKAWFAQGGGQFNWYTLGADPYGHRFGTWSISDSITRTDSPKSLGYLDIRNGA